MKNLLTYLAILSIALILNSCDKPAPTELIDDTPELEVELLTKDLNNQYYNSGVDTSGMEQDIRGLTNIISVSGIKITRHNKTDVLSLAQAMFFDRSQPIYYSDGKTLLAYKTITPGIIRFDDHVARIVPFRIRYRDMGMQRDTVIGNRYLLYSGKGGWQDPFRFKYNSSINFALTFLNQTVDFDILTPPEIFGNMFIKGQRSRRNIEAFLEWNGRGFGKITIVVGVIRPNHFVSIPIYKFRTRDDGTVQIPKRFFSELPLGNFEKMVFTFVRSYERLENTGENKLLVSSQSIHSIVIDIP